MCLLFVRASACTPTMSEHKQPSPPRFRYLKARLQPLIKFQVWGTAIVLSLVGFSTWAYFTHPEWFAFLQIDQESTPATSTASDANLSDEDKAIGADIDNLSVLQQDLAAGQISIKPDTKPSEQQGLFDEFIKNQGNGDPKKSADLSVTNKSPSESSIANPFGVKAGNILNNGSNLVSPNSTSEGSLNLGSPIPASTLNLPTSLNQNTGALSVSPLQSALDRNASGNISTVQNPSATTISPLQSSVDRLNNSHLSPQNQAADKQGQSTTGLNQTDSTGRLTPSQSISPYNSSTGYPVPVPGQGYTSTSPVSGTTGYNVPPVSNPNPVNSYTYLNQPQTVPQTVQGVPSAVPINPSLPTTSSNLGQSPLPGGVPVTGYSGSVNSNVGNTGLQPSQLPSQPNFSVPRPIPGRNIGGGEINSFSNP